MQNINEKNIRAKIEKLGYRIVYVPHKIIEDYNACYRVEYKGKLIFPPAADKLGIPVNEIWISEKWREFEEYILYHELMEIKHRAESHTVKKAHELANKNADERYKDDPKYERLRREINIASKETLMELTGISEDLAQKIIKNRPYHSINELPKKIPLMNATLFKRIRKHFWCIN